MTELDQLIEAAFKSEGQQETVNKVYLSLLKTDLFVPIKKTTEDNVSAEEPFIPLFAKVDDKLFMVVFDTLERLTAWAGNDYEKMDYVELMGREVVTGINENVYLCLNLGTPFYKEFSPDEVQRLKMVVGRIEQLMRKE